MKKLPDILPDYTIEPMTEPPFPVRWEELMGWFIVPRLGEKLSWAMYDFPEKKRTELCAMEVTGKDKEFLLDVVGRYKVTMGGKVYTRSASSTSRPIMTAPSASSSWMKTAGPSSGGGSTGTTGP